MSEQRNIILAVVLSAIVLFGWQYFFAAPQMQAEKARVTQTTDAKQNPIAGAATNGAEPGATGSTAPQPGAVAATPVKILPRDQALAQSSARAKIDTPTLDGSIDLMGGRFDDLRLKNYRETIDPKSPEIELLSPSAAEHPYFVEFGWTGAPGATTAVPGTDTKWDVTEGDTLSPGHDVTLTYDNGQGLKFTRHVSVDDRYMFTVTDAVENTGNAPAVLYPYGLVSRHNVPNTTRYWVVHEGFVGVANDTLKDATYKDLDKNNDTQHFDGNDGWVAITDKYWMAAAIPPQGQDFTGTYKAFDSQGSKAYQADYLMKPRTVAPGAKSEVVHRMFAGAKIVNVVDDYRNQGKIARFDLAVDWGWFFFLTKPIFLAIDYIYHYVGNFGVAILIFTVFVKLLFFPLANTSYRAMSKMKKLQPEMERVKQLHAEDRAAQQQAIMELYRKEKVNPAAGCLPMLVQIPVFFSLYKVLFVTIEMRGAPFFGWIHDLSAPDPTSVFNLFGLIPFALPHVLVLGVWPLIMGLTMWVQTNLNPPPGDPVQAKIFQFMPLMFMFMLANFPAGLVIYWAWNNTLSVLQQTVIRYRTGTPVDLFNRLGHRFTAAEKPQIDKK